MRKTTCSICGISLFLAAGCALDTGSRDDPPAPEGTATASAADTTSGAGPALESLDGYPYRLVDRFVAFSDLAAMLGDATSALPGVLKSGDAANAANELLQKVQLNAPPSRLGFDPQSKRGGVRLVQVYTDAPVYVIGGFILLPDAAGHPVTPSSFALDGTTDSLAGFCTQIAPERCIPLSRDHVENRMTSVVVLAARTIIVRGVNYTDGMSLVTMSETLSMPRATDLLDLSAHDAIYVGSDGSSWPSTIDHPGSAAGPNSASTLVLPYRSLPRSPMNIPGDAVTLETTTNPDIVWQRQRAAAMLGVPLNPRQGLAGLAGGSWLALTMRSSKIQARSVGQHGGYGGAGPNVGYPCALGVEWPVPPLYTVFPDCYDTSRYPSAMCDRVCGPLAPVQDGGAGGAGGDAGAIHVVSAADTAPWCAFSEASLRDPHPARPGLFGDAAEGYNVRCADGAADDRDPSAVDCGSSFCDSELNVTVCGSKEATLIDLAGSPVRAPGPIGPFLSAGVSPAAKVTSKMPIGGLPGPELPPIDPDTACGDSRSIDTVTIAAGPGALGGVGAGVWTAFCDDTDLGYSAYPLQCGSSKRGASGLTGSDGVPPPEGAAAHARAAWTRLAWAIAMHRVAPLEIPRRLAVAHQRFRAGELDSARARYLSTQFLLAANQRRVAGAHTDGKIYDCSTTVAVPATPSGGTSTTATPAPAGLTDICALRVELDTYLARIRGGRNFYGYDPDYAVPRVVQTADVIHWANIELLTAKSALATWQLASAIHDVAKEVTTLNTAGLADQISQIESSYAPGGSLWQALENARAEQSASIAEMHALDAMAKKDTAYLLILKNDDDTESTFSFDAFEMKVIGFGIKAAMTAAGYGEVAGFTSDAITSAIGKDSVGWDGSDNVRLNTLANEIDGGLPSGTGAALDAESTPSGSRDLQRLKLQGELFQIILRERDEARSFARALREQLLVSAQIAEAQAAVQRLTARLSDYSAHGPATLDALLDADYTAALHAVRRAGEYVFLAERAVERDVVPYAVDASGSRTNVLVPTLDAMLASCGSPSAKSSVNVDVRLDPANLDCYGAMVTALEGVDTSYVATAYGAGVPFTKVIPLLPSMRFIDESTGRARYAVSADVSLDDVHAIPLLEHKAGHKLADMTVLLDTGVSTPDAGAFGVSFSRRDKDTFWLGATTSGGGTGADASEFLVAGGAGGGPLGPFSAAPLQVAFLLPGWTAEPTLTFGLCRGSAAANASLLTSPGGPPAACRLSASSTSSPFAAARAYIGRGLLGRYDFVVPEEALAGTGSSALRVQFQFTSRDPD